MPTPDFPRVPHLIVTEGGAQRELTDSDFMLMAEFMGGFGQTYQNLTLYVDPVLGHDDNLGNNPGIFAMKTVNAALARIPGKRIRHFVNVKCAPGTYEAFSVQGFVLDPLTDGNICGLFIEGGVSETTRLTQSSPSGSITSSTTGATATASWTTVVDDTKNWVANQLKGMMVKWVVGATTTILEVESNDATSFKVMTASVAPANGTSYSICDANAVVAGEGVTVPGSLPTITSAATASTKAWIWVGNNISSTRTTAIRIEGFRVAPPTTGSTDNGILIDTQTAVVAIGRCQVAQLTGTTFSMTLTGNGSISFTSFSCFGPVSAGGVVTSMGPNITTNGFLIAGNPTTGLTCGSSHGQGLSLFNVQIEAAIGINVNGFCNMSLSGVVRIPSGGSSQGIRARVASSCVGGVHIHLAAGSGLEMIGRSIGVELVGSHHCVLAGNLILTSCPTGIQCGQGAKCQVSAGSTMTTVTNELITDEVTDTLANMRAASPKVQKSSNYFSAIFE